MKKLKLIMHEYQGDLEVEREHLRELRKMAKEFKGLKQELLNKHIELTELKIFKIMQSIKGLLS